MYIDGNNIYIIYDNEFVPWYIYDDPDIALDNLDKLVDKYNEENFRLIAMNLKNTIEKFYNRGKEK